MARTETWNGSTDQITKAADWTPDQVVPGFGDTAIIPSGEVDVTGALNGIAFQLGDTTNQGLLPTLAATNATFGSSLSISDIPGGGTSQLTVSGTLASSATILVTNFGSDLVVNNAAGTSSTFDQAAGSVTITAGELDLNTATVQLDAAVSVSSAGLLVVNNFNPNQTAVALQGTGTVDLAAGSTFEDLAVTTSGITVQFDDPTNSTLMIGGTFTGAVTGFDVNNVIDFSLIPAADAATYQAGVLTLTNAGTVVGAINLTGSAITSNTKFLVTSDNNGGVKVSVAPAYVTGVTTNPASGALGAGAAVTLTVATSSPLRVNTTGGTPTLTLNDGGTATYDAATSSGTSLVFDYTIASGDNTPDLAVTALNLNGATITDNAGGAANLAAAVTNPAGTLVIDTAAPVVAPAALTVAGGAGATPIGIAAPTSAGFTAAQLVVKGTALPNDGFVRLADGTTAVTLGETLTAAQLAGLTFTPSNNAANPSSAFSYTVTDPAANTTPGTATLTVSTSETWNGASAPFGTAADWSAGVVPGSGDTAIITSGTVSLTGKSNGVAFQIGDPTGQGLLPTLATTDLTLGSLTSISDIAGGGTSQISVTGTLVDFGAILVTNFGSALVVNNAAGVSGSFVSPGSAITINAGEVDLNTASVTVNSAVSVSNGGLFVVNNFSPEQTPVTFVGGGTIDLSSQSTFEDFATSTQGITIQFDDATDNVAVLGGGFTGGQFHGQVTGFDVNNVIDFAAIPAATSATYAAGVLSLINAGTTVATIALSGPNVTASTVFTVGSDHSGGVQVSIAPSTVLGVTASGAATALTAGTTTAITLAITDNVLVNTSGGVPTLTLNDGGTATYDSATSTANQLVFDYTVAAGQQTAALAVTALNLNGATVTDNGGRLVNLAGAVGALPGPVVVSALPPAAPAITSGNEVTVSTAPVLTGTAAPGSTVAVFAGTVSVGTATADGSGNFSATLGGLGLGANTITATAQSTGGTSPASAAVTIYELPAATNGVVVVGISSATLAGAAGSGGLGFLSGVQQVQLVDGTLSVGTGTQEATIQRLYVGLLGHTADQGGLSFYQQALNSGASLTTIATDILVSPEYQITHPGLSDAQFVTTLYQNDLGRTDPLPDFWTNALAQGASRATVAVGFANTPEVQTRLASQTANLFATDTAGALVHQVYETGLGREVDLPGLAAAKTALASITPLKLVQGITGSPEFTALHGGQSNADFVTSLFQAGLGRAPDAPGAAYWTNLLNGGTGRADVTLGIATTAEAVLHLTRPTV